MNKISEVLTRAVEKVYPSKEELEKMLKSGRKLKIYQGFDPTGKLLHLGHMIGLMKLRQFQNLGHEVIFLIGDGTGQAGDPSGKKRTRERFFSNAELRENAKNYVMQASKIVKFDGPNPARIVYNSEWLNKLTLVDILEIASHFSLQQLEERDLYSERKKSGQEINMREFLYPLLQGYDSVALAVDMEIGGSDQTFNMLCGRKLEREILNKEKFVLTMPILADSSGKKIGKTEGNVIALTAKPNDLYGMIMTLPDDVIVNCFTYLTDTSMTEINAIRQALAQNENPMTYKKKLAFALTALLNTPCEAEEAQKYFERTFQEKKLPDKLPEIILKGNGLTILELAKKASPKLSGSEIRRLITAGALEINGIKYTDPNMKIQLPKENIFKIGKHTFIKIIRK